MERTKPYKARSGRLNITVFKHMQDDGELRFDTRIERRYEKDGQWKSGAFSERDLEDLDGAKVLAEQYIAKQKSLYEKTRAA